MTIQPFHLAIPVRDIEEARRFYSEVLGLAEGRSTDHWVDFNMMGHQLVVHLAADHIADVAHNAVDGEAVPVPHFGVVLDMPSWKALAEKLRASAIEFVIEPTIRFKGEAGEQATMFFRDPSGNALEFKAFEDIGQLFAK
ncbi:MAG: VOC family protein [Acidihalobacter sp.]|jgi:uncharacterized protein